MTERSRCGSESTSWINSCGVTGNAGRALIIATADRDDPTEFDGAVQATRSWLVSMHFLEAERLLVAGVVRPTDVQGKPDALDEGI